MEQIKIPPYTAVICAAGRGQRLGSLTEQLPKTLLQVGQKTILEYLLDNLSACGLTEVLLAVGYQGELIEKKLGNKYQNCNLTYVYNKDYEITDNYYSMYLTKEKIKQGMIFFNSDIIFNKNILEKILTDGYDNSLAVVDTDSPGAGKNPVRVKLSVRGELLDIGNDLGEEPKQMVFGIYKLSATATKQYFELANDFFKAGPRKMGFWFPLKQMFFSLPFGAVVVDNAQWASINTKEEYETAIKLVDSILGKL